MPAKPPDSIYYDRSRDRWTGTITVAAGVRTPAHYTVEQCLKDWLVTLNTQAESTVTGYRIMVGHLVEMIGNVKLSELKVRGVDFALGKLAKHLSTRSVAWTCLSIRRTHWVAG